MADELPELKPCPFCGGDDIRLHSPTCHQSTPYDPTDRMYPIAICSSCYAEVAGACNDGPSDNRSVASAIAAWNTRKLDDCPDEAYDLGVSDGYEKAVQDIDVMLGGDGEYFASTLGDDCPDAAAMKVKILDRWNTRTPPKVKPLVWVCEGGWRWKGVPPDGFFKSVAKWVWEKPSGGFKHAGSVEVFDTIDAAKAAAQVDYERRILSALE